MFCFGESDEPQNTEFRIDQKFNNIQLFKFHQRLRLYELRLFVFVQFQNHSEHVSQSEQPLKAERDRLVVVICIKCSIFIDMIFFFVPAQSRQAAVPLMCDAVHTNIGVSPEITLRSQNTKCSAEDISHRAANE